MENIFKKINIDKFFATDFLSCHYQKQRMDFYTISHLFPYNLYDSNSRIFINENSLGFLLEIEPISGFDESAIDRLSSCISSMEEFMTMSVMNYATPEIDGYLDDWIANKSQNKNIIFKSLASERVNYLKKQKFRPLFSNPEIVGRNFRIILSLSITLDDFRRSKNSLLSKKKLLKLDQEEFEEIAEKLEKFRSELRSVIASINSSSRDLDSNDLINLLRSIFSFNKKYNKSNHDLINPINREISDDKKNIEVKEDYLLLNNGDEDGDFFAKTISVTSYPQYWSQNNNDSLLGGFMDNVQICSPFINSYSFKVISQSSAKKKANAKMVRATQLAESSMAKFLPNTKERLIDARFVVAKLEENNKIIETIHQFSVFSNSKKKLNKDVRDMQNILKTSKIESHIEPELQLSNFLIQLPFIAGNLFIDDYIKLGKTKKQLSWTASNIMPLIGEWKGNLNEYSSIKRGNGLILFGRRGGIINWSPFENEAGGYNCAIIGGTGSGKSFFMQDVVLNHLASNSKVFIIDDGFSFENTTKITGGEFIEFSDKYQININPFGFINLSALQNEKELGEYRRDVSSFLKNIIARMCRNETECSEEEKSDISKAIKFILDQYVATEIIPTISDVANHLAKESNNRSQNLAHLLFNFTKKGPYGSYFNDGNPINVTNNLMNFELSKINGDKHLLSVVMMSIMYLVSEYIYIKGGKEEGGSKNQTLIVIDEGWAMLKGGKSMVEFIEGLARRCRKYSGSLITGTQKISDYTQKDNPGAKACLDNSDWKIILRQNDTALAELKKEAGFSDNQISVIKSLKKSNNFSEMVITGPSIFTVGRFICDPISAMLYSTKKEHRDRKNQLIDNNYPVFEAIKQVTKEFFNYG